MKFMAINLRDYHEHDKWEGASVKCRILTLNFKNMERAKRHLSTFYPEEAWLLTRCDMTKNIAYAQV
jgi:hypothetical protein